MTTPTLPITKIVDLPTPESLQRLKRELLSCAIVIKKRGSSKGHAALVLSDIEYQKLIGGAKPEEPEDPQDAPDYSLAENNDDRWAMRESYKIQTEIFDAYSNAEIVLSTALYSALNEDVRASIINDPTLMGGSCLDILTYLSTTYGAISPSDLVQNERKLREVWHPTEPILSLWTRVDVCMNIATEGNTPLHDITVINILLDIFEQTTVFTQAILSWNTKPETDEWTLANFKAHMNTHNKLRTATMKNMAYHTRSVPAEPLLHAANAITGKHENEKITRLEAEIKSLKKLTGKLPPAHGHYYCHTHGYKDHDGTQCKTPGPDHVKEASHNNIMNGSTSGHKRYSEKA